MMNPLQRLVGKKVVRADSVLDYIQIVLEGDIGLNIYNTLTPPVPEFSTLIGSRLSSVENPANELVLSFSDRSRLVVDMRAAAYNGPEALDLHAPGQPIVVWN